MCIFRGKETVLSPTRRPSTLLLQLDMPRSVSCAGFLPGACEWRHQRPEAHRLGNCADPCELLSLRAGSRRRCRLEPAYTTARLLLIVDACCGMPTQVCNTTMPDGQAGLLFQVIDTGHGLGGKDFQRLFDPLQEMGKLLTKPVALSIHEACAEVDVV